MSKHNQANNGQYHIGGILRPDDLARERMKQQETVPHHTKKHSGDPPFAPPVDQSDAGSGESEEK
jgi:hypothetical protein